VQRLERVVNLLGSLANNFQASLAGSPQNRIVEKGVNAYAGG